MHNIEGGNSTSPHGDTRTGGWSNGETNAIRSNVMRWKVYVILDLHPTDGRMV